MTHILQTYFPSLESNYMLTWMLSFMALSLRYLIFGGLAYGLFYIWRKREWFYKKIQQKYPEPKRIWHEVKYSFSSMAIFAGLSILLRVLTSAGYTQVYTDVAERGWLYLIFSTAVFVLIHDTYFYWTHRLMHHPLLFKHVHKVHHMSHNPTPWAAFSFHPLEALVEFSVVPIVIMLMPLHPIAIVLFGLYMILLNVLGHLGFEVLPSGFTKHKLLGWHNTSTHHNMHHKHVNCNYGLYFNIWDRLMRTNHAKYHSTFEQVATRRETVADPHPAFAGDEVQALESA